MSIPTKKTKRRLLDDLEEAGPSNVDSKKAKMVESNNQSKNKNNKDDKTGKTITKVNRTTTICNNNNAIPSNGSNLTKNSKNVGSKNSKKSNGTSSQKLVPIGRSSQKQIVPIIQTRRMKALGINKSGTNEISKLNKIDTLSSNEITDGDVATDGNGVVDHEGIEVTIPGSDIDDEFPDDNGEPGELPNTSSDEEEFSQETSPDRLCHRVRVPSKVVKVNRNRKQQELTPPPRSVDKYGHLCHDPEFRKFLDKMLDDREKERSTDKTSSNRHKSNRGMSDGIDIHNHNHQPLNFKSPSDTTIYSPGLRKVNQNDIALIEKISDFVENIHLDSNKQDRCHMSVDSNEITPSRRRSSVTGRSRSGSGLRSKSPKTVTRDKHRVEPRIADNHTHDCESHTHALGSNGSEQDASKVANQLLLQAEKFKVKIEAPKGNNFGSLLMPYDYEQLRTKFVKPEGLAPLDIEILFLRNFDQDDKFFHVTSQIDPSLRIKIERGEFIDLERLLPCDRIGNRSGNDDLNKQLYQLITQGTNNYLEPPVPRNGKINSIRKWDQAFRVFAAIYTHANPKRASEIWQYVYVIHTAATDNPWENVYYYDINFRELMASKPWRSW